MGIVISGGDHPRMNAQNISPELIRWIIEQAGAGRPPELLLRPLLDAGWDEQVAIGAVETVMRDYVAGHAREHGLPAPVAVPAPITLNGPSILEIDGREIRVLANLRHPHVIVFGNLLGDDECDELVATARGRLRPSVTFNADSGRNEPHRARTSQGIHLPAGCTELCARIEARIARLLDWPLENGEPLQVLRYGPGAEYQPHYDYFDPDGAGAEAALRHGGQRVASLVMYLNTPAHGGATTFPDAHFEVAAVKGNAVFFSYDRPHPMTRTLHAGAPVLEGEKWVATRWLRERAFA